jgi:hypothetical protein
VSEPAPSARRGSKRLLPRRDVVRFSWPMALIADFIKDSEGTNMTETFEMMVPRVRVRKAREGVFSHDGNEADAEFEIFQTLSPVLTLRDVQ